MSSGTAPWFCIQRDVMPLPPPRRLLGGVVSGTAWASHQLTPTVGANVRHGRRAGRAERALERANVRLAVRRQRASALLAAAPHLGSHGSAPRESSGVRRPVRRLEVPILAIDRFDPSGRNRRGSKCTADRILGL